jgi:hypothetical protein
MYKSFIIVHYLRGHHHLQTVGSLFLCFFFKVSFVNWFNFTLGEIGTRTHTHTLNIYVQQCKNILEAQSIHVLQMSWNYGHCVLWILFNTSLYFPNVGTVFVGHIHINYPLPLCGNWIHNCICAGCCFLISQTL